MDLSIIIVNYKTPQLVIDCIESIYAQTKQYSFEIIVVDNDSKDNSQQKICTAFKDIIWIDMGYNSGFARGNNAGIKIAKGNFILLLNGDTIIKEGAIDKTIHYAQKNPHISACGIQLLNEDETFQISGAYFVFKGVNLLLPYPILGITMKLISKLLKATPPSIISTNNTIEVDWVVGAFFLLKKEVINTVGYLDEDFFMYAEEIEWCSRIRKKYKIHLLGHISIIHLLGGSSKKEFANAQKQNSQNLSNIKGGQIQLSNLVRVRKQYGLFWYLIHYLIYSFSIFLFLIASIITLPLKTTKYSWANFLGYIKNFNKISGYFFSLLLNKPNFYKLYTK